MKKLPPSILKKAEETAVANPDATVTVVDVNGLVLYLSPNAQEINGVAPEDMVCRYYAEFVNQIDAANL